MDEVQIAKDPIIRRRWRDWRILEFLTIGEAVAIAPREDVEVPDELREMIVFWPSEDRLMQDASRTEILIACVLKRQLPGARLVRLRPATVE
jgi:hypothetical protein